MNLEILVTPKRPVRRTLVLLDESSFEKSFVIDAEVDSERKFDYFFVTPSMSLRQSGSEQIIETDLIEMTEKLKLLRPTRITKVRRSTLDIGESENEGKICFLGDVGSRDLIAHISIDSSLAGTCYDFLLVDEKWTNGSLCGSIGYCISELNKLKPFIVKSFVLLG